MGQIVLRHHGGVGRALLYDTESGRHLLVEASRAPSAPSRGSFVEVMREVYGVYGSAQGPVFFAGRRRIVLQPRRFAIVRRMLKGGVCGFVLHAEGEEALEVRYRPPGDTDPWSHELDPKDFFAWLELNAEQRRFFAWLTIP
jgi:hypothetical protein